VKHVKRILGFVLVPILSFASSLLLLPLISQRFGANGLSALTIGQSVGAFASVVVGLAWPVVGGQRVAVASGVSTRQALLADSYATRGLVLTFCAVPTALVSALLAPQYHIEAAVFGLAIAGNGLTSGWYYAGVGEPLPAILYEGVTRLAAYGIALVGMSLGLGLWAYAVTLLLWVPVMGWLNWRHVMRGRGPSSLPSLGRTIQLVQQQKLGTSSRLAQAGFGFGGPSLFAVLNPSHLAVFSASDQIQKTATNGAQAVINAFIHWVGVCHGQRRRALTAMFVCVAGSLLFLLAWTLVGAQVITVVFAGEIHLTPPIQALLGLSIAILFLTRASELLIMVPRGLERLVYQANTIFSLAGLLAMVLVAPRWGVPGGLMVVICYALILLGLYSGSVAYSRRRRKKCRTAPAPAVSS
jgi:hypothetical protein